MLVRAGEEITESVAEAIEESGRIEKVFIRSVLKCEAPRGICWHQYRVEGDGSIASARIIPPTSQNLATIEDDLVALAPGLGNLTDDAARLRCEHLIRNYDPCISCSVHFLRFTRTMR